MTLTVNIKNVPSEVNRPYIVVRFCNGELWYYGQYDDVERANDVAEGLGMATVFDNSSYNAIEALEQEPIEVEATKLQMAYNQGFEDCREAVIDELKKWDWQELYLPIHFKENIIDVIPSVNPQEPKTGHWSHDGSHWKNRFICSECGYKLFDEPTNYCPKCGAKMESEDKE